MMTSKKPSNTEEKNIYELSKLTKSILPLLGISMLLFGFSLNFNIESALLNVLNKNLKLNNSCKINVGNIQTELLTLGFNADQFSLSEKCPNELNFLKKIYFGFRGISFSPIGIKIKSIINSQEISDDLQLIVSIGFNAFKLIIDDQKVNIGPITEILSLPLKMSGSLAINGVISGTFNKISEANLEISSDKIKMPNQEIQGFITPAVILNDNTINFSLNSKNDLVINGLKLGNNGNLLEILGEGKILNALDFKKTNFDLQGKFRMSTELNKEIPLFGLMLNGKEKKQGFYLFDLLGNPTKPQFKIR